MSREMDLKNEVRENEVAEGTEELRVAASCLWYMLTVLI